MKISVVIPTMNRASDLRAVLESVLSQTEPPFEVILIDQSTTDDSRDVVSEMKEAAKERAIYLRYVYQTEKSLVKARNRGLLLATGDIISFLDDDVVLFPDYFSAILRAFAADPALAAVGGNVQVKSTPSGFKWKLRKAMMKFFLLNSFDGKMTASGFGYPIFERIIDRPVEVELLPGCDMNFRKEFLGEETFDEWLSGYSFREDVEFSYRISKKGRCLMIPGARLYHNYSQSSRMDMEHLSRMMIQNYYFIFQKHMNRRFYSRLLFAYSLLGLIFIDIIEFLSHRDPERFSKIRGEVTSSIGIMLGGVK